jgi:multiple sugar transport system permease protein
MTGTTTAAPTSGHPGRRSRLATRLQNAYYRAFRGQRVGYLFVAPAILFLLAFTLYPLLQALLMSLFEISKTGAFGGWIGLTNYAALLHDANFLAALGRSLEFAALAVVGCLLLGAGLAQLLNRSWLSGHTTNSLRGLAILPWLFPISVAALMWGLLLHRDGLLNAVLKGLGLISRPVMWLGNPDLALFSLVAIFVWRCAPFVMVMVLAALKSIPQELYEAAQVDGATRWQSYRLVTVPLIAPVLLTLSILCFVWGAGQFDLVKIVTGGGPMRTTEVASYYIYRVGFLTVDWSYGSAISMAVFLVLLLAAIVYLFVSRRVRPWD